MGCSLGWQRCWHNTEYFRGRGGRRSGAEDSQGDPSGPVCAHDGPLPPSARCARAARSLGNRKPETLGPQVAPASAPSAGRGACPGSERPSAHRSGRPSHVPVGPRGRDRRGERHLHGPGPWGRGGEVGTQTEWGPRAAEAEAAAEKPCEGGGWRHRGRAGGRTDARVVNARRGAPHKHSPRGSGSPGGGHTAGGTEGQRGLRTQTERDGQAMDTEPRTDQTGGHGEGRADGQAGRGGGLRATVRAQC